jgi:exosortase family protein XrtM
MNKPIPGKDYWPNQTDWPTTIKNKPKSLINKVVLFALLFILMQIIWQIIRDENIGHFIRATLTVKPVVVIINEISPQIGAIAKGNQILAPGGGLVIKIGCEGVEALFILIAALLTSQLKWRYKLHGIINGTILIYIFNQLRILILFYTFRTNKAMFELLHSSIAPLTLVSIACLYYYYWLVKHESIAKK